MDRYLLLWSGLGAAALVAVGASGWILTLPAASKTPSAPPVPQPEADAILSALKPIRNRTPLIAVIGINNATETLDYLMPAGILRRANIGQVMMLATGNGPVRLFPTLQVMPDATLTQFDTDHPGGADYVIVPAMGRDDDPVILAWIKAQSHKGAMIIGVCAGARIVANTGLLDGKRATTHWYYVKGLRANHPAVHYVADRRLVTDRGVATTTGITASMPMALSLIEAIAGRDKAQSVAASLGLDQWDARHDSAAFRFNRPFALTAMKNSLSFWAHETFGFELEPGMDEVALALVADAWSRTYRSRAVSFAGKDGPVQSANGLRLLPDRVASGWPAATLIPGIGSAPAIRALDGALADITRRYGSATERLVAMQLEYPEKASNSV
jgi:putative intracellular protease/amidase